MAAQPAYQRFIADPAFIFFRQRHLDAGKQQKRAENVQQPFELRNQPATGEDHDRTQHDRAQNAVHQHSTLQRGGHREVAEQHQPDEDVIYRQRFLDQIAGEKRQRLRVGHRAALGLHQIPPECSVKQ